MNDRKNAASTEKSGTEEAKASASEELASQEATEWDARQKSAGEELGAIDKAKEILEDGVKVFLQVQSKTSSSSDDDKRQEVTEIVRKLNSKHHMFAFSQLVSAAQSDPFGKVRGLIESMIDRLTNKAELLEQIKALEKSIADMDAGQAEATKLRQEE